MENSRVILFSLIILFGCKDSDGKRETIDLFNAPDEIEQTMLTVHTLLDSISKKGDVVGYFFDLNNSLFINGKLQYDLTDDLKVKRYYNSNAVNAKFNAEILSKTIFLRRNLIHGGYYDKSFGIFLFNYKPAEENRYENLLYLMVNPTNDTIIRSNTLEKLVQIERVKNISLVKPTSN
ncbi:hypothetical protein [Carboxylicivirga sp. M1479]|uniref:hypothetical protein n=1 Tax=Carboxylicivirga sp. M1479 TaxID=2594476 RepID=UPI00117795FC|nr:hypothetical protein [Carboxylicivirga sp. M1479]TRX62987.1 hypothetical protein FNN09_19375 [Carboxylicivirga sp. M1479]